MGENDDKESKPAAENGPEPEPEAKETDKMLKNEEKTEAVEKKEDEKKEEKTDEVKKSTENVTTSNGDEIIEIPDEKPSEGKPDNEKEEEKKKLKVEEKEVKPKKIPIGGIKMPGFFTKKKEKENDGADNELLEKNEEAEKEKPKEEEKPKRPSLLANFRFRNPFAKKPAAPTTEAVENAENAEKKDDDMKAETESKDEVTAEATDLKPADVDKKEETEKKEEEKEEKPQKKSVLSSIKLPQVNFANLLPKRNKKQADDIELGNGPNNKANLASMETLDDSMKDNNSDAKDTVDKNGGAEGDALVQKDVKDKEEDEQIPQNMTLLERVQSYRCTLDDLAIAAGIFIFVLLVAAILAFVFMGKSEPSSAPIRDGKFIEAITSCGKVEGMLEDSSFAFRGIPYAIPPLGDNRWRPAEVIENIDYCWNGTLKAHNSSNTCWQMYANGTVDGSEDCLTLDVVTPYVRYENPLPVVVLIGAESMTGDSPGKLRPSARFARARDVIFVRPNFRVGVFGFLALDQLSKSVHPPTSGNYGLSDIIAALKWIQLNIAHFGGDPKAVTLFGHRAGGTLVATLTASDVANKLFARAWISSGGSHFPGKPLAESEKLNTEYLTQSQINCTTGECMKEKEDEDLLDAVPDTWRRMYADLPLKDENTTSVHEWLVLDGEILKEHPADAWKREGGPPKMVLGTTAHESHSEKLLLKHKEWTPELVKKHIEESAVGALAEEALQRYNATYQGLVAMISDIRTVCPLWAVANSLENVPFYVVKQTTGQLAIADVDSDVQAILGRYEPKTPEQRRYVQSMQLLFYYFVSHGDVKQIDAGRKILEIGQDPLPVKTLDNCEFWMKHDIVPRYARLD